MSAPSTLKTPATAGRISCSRGGVSHGRLPWFRMAREQLGFVGVGCPQWLRDNILSGRLPSHFTALGMGSNHNRAGSGSNCIRDSFLALVPAARHGHCRQQAKRARLTTVTCAAEPPPTRCQPGRRRWSQCWLRFSSACLFGQHWPYAASRW